MYYSKIYSRGSGLTNQIFAFITSIIIAIYKKESVVVLDQFLDDFSKEEYTIISRIIDLEQMNIFLFRQYGIVLIDRHNIDSRIVSENMITEMNENKEYSYRFGWIHDINKELFETILLNIRFHSDFVEKADHFIQTLKGKPPMEVSPILHLCPSGQRQRYRAHLKMCNVHRCKKTNVIHLRVEDDAITHWSNMNHMSEGEFRSFIENKYIELIKQYIDKDDDTIILSSSSTNGVIDFFEREGYCYTFTDKHFAGREKNAIVDLLISKCCNNIFIGNFNPVKLNGSSFSYFVLKLLDHDVKKIMIDLDRIQDVEIIQ